MAFSAEKMAQMAQKGGLPGQPEVGPWADPEFPPVHGRARKLVLSRRTEGLLAYSAASAAAVDAEVVARGLELVLGADLAREVGHDTRRRRARKTVTVVLRGGDGNYEQPCETY